MSDWSDSTFRRELEADTLNRAFRARLDAMRESAGNLLERHRHDAAMALLSAGICLIPSDHLQDHQFVVSRGVYDVARKATEKGG